MSKYLLMMAILSITLLPNYSFSQTQPLGWASLNGGTTGGFGGNIQTVNNRTDFVNAVSGDESKVILIQDTIELNLYEKVAVGSNKTIRGLTENAMIRFGGLELKGDNIIVQNLVIGDFYDGDWSGTTNSTDCLTIFGENIWVDHCWFWAGADGLLDIRSGNGSIADFVTISYCRFSDHNKVTLVGSSDASIEDRDHLRVTFHHCWYDGTIDKGLHQRNPRVRFGDVHIFNNYYEEIGSYCIAARIESDLVVENTYFRNCPNPHEINDLGIGLEDPDLLAINNKYELCEGTTTENGDAFDPTSFYIYSPTKINDVPTLVMNEAGPFNPEINQPPIATNDSIDFSNVSGSIQIDVIENDFDIDSDDLRLTQIENEFTGFAFIKENKIIYGVSSSATGIDTIAYSLVDTEGGIDTGFVYVFLDGIPTNNKKIGESTLIEIFPNPTHDFIFIKPSFQIKKDFDIQLIDAKGNVIRKLKEIMPTNMPEITLDTQFLKNGVYIISIQNDQKIYTKKITVIH